MPWGAYCLRVPVGADPLLFAISLGVLLFAAAASRCVLSVVVQFVCGRQLGGQLSLPLFPLAGRS